jgi:hypothetical protein
MATPYFEDGSDYLPTAMPLSVSPIARSTFARTRMHQPPLLCSAISNSACAEGRCAEALRMCG